VIGIWVGKLESIHVRVGQATAATRGSRSWPRLKLGSTAMLTVVVQASERQLTLGYAAAVLW
jgi:hypothetical protein